MRECSRDTHRLGVEGGRGRNDYTTLHGLMGGARFWGLEGEVTRRVGHGAPCLSDSRLYLLRQAARNPSFTHVLEGTSLSTISRVFVPIFFFGQSIVVDVEGVGFRPKAVVAGRGVVAVCTRISSQECVYDN